MTNKDIVPILTKEVSPFVKTAEKLEIIDAKDMQVATELLSTLNRMNDQATDHKELLTKPLNTALKEIRSRYKPLETVFEESISIVRRKMSAYQTETMRIANEAAEKLANRVGEGKGKLRPETAVRKMSEIESPAQSVSTTTGSVKFRPVKHFEVVNLHALMKEYLLPNEVAIRAAMKQGIELAGVRYFTTQEPVNSR